MSEQDAQDIAQMNTGNEIPFVGTAKKKSGLLWVVLACVVVGVTLGIVVYQQSLKPATKITTPPKTTSASVAPKVSPVASPVTPAVSVVDAAPKTVSFPKAGKLRVYYQNGSWMPVGFILKDAAGGGDSFTIGSGASSTPMKILDTGYELTGPTTLTIDSYLGSNSSQLSIGWAVPQSNSCGFNGFGTFSVAPYVTWVTEQAKGEPIVSQQCWGDYSPNAKDTSAKDFNDYFVIFSYTPAGTSPSPSSSVKASPSPSPSASIVASLSPSPSASVKASILPSPSPSPSVKASIIATSSVEPSPSVRVAMPDTGEGVPVTGVFEITVGTVGVGLLLLVLGLAGLLVL